ncbi:MAG: hypothetical protein Q8R79_01950 [Legionellaceae bacterium]|nr:hypothetical protein [Legionellaceae bacterium]
MKKNQEALAQAQKVSDQFVEALKPLSPEEVGEAVQKLLTAIAAPSFHMQAHQDINPSKLEVVDSKICLIDFEASSTHVAPNLLSSRRGDYAPFAGLRFTHFKPAVIKTAPTDGKSGPSSAPQS